jgi:hypothetical protein
MAGLSASVKKALWAWHRRLGALVAVLVLLLSLSGIALNHTEALRLDERYVESRWLLDWYGVEPPEAGFGFVAGDRRITLLGDHLYADRHLVGEPFNALQGAVVLEGMLAVAADGDVLLLTPDLELVDRLDRYQGVPAGLRDLGVTDEGRLVVRTESGLWLADEQLLSWASVPERGGIGWAAAAEPPARLLADLRRDFRQRMLTLERALLDVHSGRLFGRFGPLVMDVAAVLMAVLAVSGFWLWSVSRPRG